MKKLCFVTTTSATLKSFVTETAYELHRLHPDYKITFICDNDPEFAQNLPPFIHFYPIAMKRGISFGDIGSIFKMMSFFRSQSFDMVQYSTPNASLYAAVASKLAGIKCRLYCQWGIRYVGFTGFKRRIFKFFEKISCRFATQINAVSRKNLEFAVNEGLYSKDKAVVIGNGGTIGVDLSQYDLKNRHAWREEKRRELGIEGQTVFGFVGRLTSDKGTRELLSAVKHLSETENIVLVCVGKCEIQDPGLFKLYEWASKSKNVIFTGPKEKSEVCKYYAVMDVYVHPTYREGFGMVLQEAGAMECAVITTDIPGAGEVFENNVSCLLAKAGDTESLTECMKKLLDNVELRQQIGAAARKRVEERYCREDMLRNQMARYEKLLQE